MTDWRDSVRRVIPQPILPVLTKMVRRTRSLRKSLSRSRIPAIGLEALIHNLHRAGFGPGDTLMVHSSLSKIGNVNGGPDTVIRSLMETVTDSGTIVMPCYSDASEVFRIMDEGGTIDLRNLPSLTGRISEAFRKTPSVLRSSHPFSSVCAWGKHSHFITEAHAISPFVCHEESPIARVVKLGGTVIGIGIGVAQGLGVAHMLEDTWKEFPVKVHAAPKIVRYIDSFGIATERELVRFDPEVSKTRIDSPGAEWIENRFHEHFSRIGLMKPFCYGLADAWSMETQSLFNELHRLAQKGVTIYHTPEMADEKNRDVLSW